MTELGELVLSVHYASPDDRIGRLKVEHDDPVAWASAEVIGEVRAGNGHPDAEIDDDLLTIHATNRTVVYRIGEYDPERRACLLTWPD